MKRILDVMSVPRATSKVGPPPDVVGDASREKKRRQDAEGVGRVDQRVNVSDEKCQIAM
jgi:hypothetical protein